MAAGGSNGKRNLAIQEKHISVAKIERSIGILRNRKSQKPKGKLIKSLKRVVDCQNVNLNGTPRGHPKMF